MKVARQGPAGREYARGTAAVAADGETAMLSWPRFDASIAAERAYRRAGVVLEGSGRVDAMHAICHLGAQHADGVTIVHEIGGSRIPVRDMPRPQAGPARHPARFRKESGRRILPVEHHSVDAQIHGGKRPRSGQEGHMVYMRATLALRVDARSLVRYNLYARPGGIERKDRQMAACIVGHIEEAAVGTKAQVARPLPSGIEAMAQRESVAAHVVYRQDKTRLPL